MMGRTIACIIGLSAGVALGTCMTEENMKKYRKAIKRMKWMN